MAVNTKNLLIAQMRRAIELLESADMERVAYSRKLAEMDSKFLEIRRDSIRFMKIARNPYKYKK